jgi:hypothetical protein
MTNGSFTELDQHLGEEVQALLSPVAFDAHPQVDALRTLYTQRMLALGFLPAPGCI